MSKECCGNIYNEDEKFCTVCGKKLEDIDEGTQISEENAQNKLDAMNLPIMNLEEIEKLTADLKGMPVGESVEKKEGFAEAAAEVGTEDSQASEEVSCDENQVQKVEKEDEAGYQEKKESDESKDKKGKPDIKFDFDDDEDDENKASAGLKFLGALSLIVMFASMGAVALGLIFVMFKPFYKDYDVSKDVIYPEIATATDGIDQTVRPMLSYVVLEEDVPATDTDAQAETMEEIPEEAVEEDAEVTEQEENE